MSRELRFMKTINDCMILLVDDTKSNVDVLVNALKGMYKLGVSLNGEEAIRFVKQNLPDLILLDIVMPGTDGFDVCHRLKADPRTRDIPIIFITAMDDLTHKTKGFDVGAVDYITKPFDITEVKARVKTHLTLKLAGEALKNQNAILEEMVRERTKELRKAQIEVINRLGKAAEYRDQDTGTHINRMSKYCRLMGKALGLSREEYDRLDLASTMHDVGKIGISDNILLKPGKLDTREWESMRSHTRIGEELLSGGTSQLLEVARIIAMTHHEKWDGTGYHQHLKGKDIPMVGRITCICDVFDALISRRPYKDPWPVDEALAEIKKGSGVFFDPELVEVFLSLEPEIRKIVATHQD
ncbi:cyclic di-GMP phosphodiesterase response regulator RpfG [Desulfotignum phosphitoxidans DSM 13687]|uniref:Cyclic di-GMP phosphodiesterase response regulator RpfG n=2 Tax=Desulfotignum phosphitoxidans TaxID=190898 RepID=S0G755_9BACT|nr:cyclic di-GMP phosphodiesterase response regulator RpfG [Desulfotignum phosphitoxidans DSM 13687]